ncbi:MAG: acyloxyacyl hydrolase [Desulfobacteraceae bacterium]|nr:acyloxyacyl hydrolase [Desulfobacteraceae bacterium]
MFFVTIEQVPAGDDYAETMSGMSVNLGYTYDPADKIWFGQVSLFMLYDYDRIWPHKAPEALRFKVEGSFGGSHLEQGDIRFNAGINIFALYYLTDFETDSLRPYVEAGIGGMFTDYQVTGQDYRFNFNPQAGIGIEFKKDNFPPYFLSLRLHHLSNAGIGDTNRGLNSVVCMFGRYF